MPLERQELIVNCRARQPTARVAFLSRLFRNRLPATDPSLAVGYSGRRSFPSRCSNGVGTQTYAPRAQFKKFAVGPRSEEPTSELQSLMRISYAVFCLKKTKQIKE